MLRRKEMLQNNEEFDERFIKRVNEIVNNNPNKQITFNYYISNIERILNIIKTNPRKVVLDAYYSYVLKVHKKLTSLTFSSTMKPQYYK